MDLAELTREFKRLHELAKRDELSCADRDRWQGLKRKLSTARAPERGRADQPAGTRR